MPQFEKEPDHDTRLMYQLESGSLAGKHELLRRSPLEGLSLTTTVLYLLVAFIGAVIVFGRNKWLSGAEIAQSGKSLDKELAFPVSSSESNGKQSLTLKDVRQGKFYPDMKRIQWIQLDVETGGTYLTRADVYFIVKKIEDNDYQRVLYNSLSFEFDGESHYILELVASPDLRHALLSSDRDSIWRYSSTNLMWLLDIETQSIVPLDHSGERIFFAKWAPDSVHIAYVKKDQNVYVKNSITGEVTQVTYDGGANIFNGKPDWVYEEEVFESEYALWWSPNSEYLAYLKFDDTEVESFPLEFFVPNRNPKDSYPVTDKLKYPKAGYKNPKLGVNVFELANKKTEELFNNHQGKEFQDYLVTEVLWVGNSDLFLRTTDRISTELKIVIVDAVTMEFKIARHEVAENGWFELSHDTYYIPLNSSVGRPEDGYIDTITVDGYNHLAYYTPIDSSEPAVILTKGKYEVVGGVSAFDPENNKVFFISTKYSSIDRHIYSVDLLTGSKETPLVDDTVSGYYSASFSHNAKNILVSYLGPDVPYQKIVSLNDKSAEIRNVFENSARNFTLNERLSETLRKYNLPTTQFGELDIGEGVIANIREIKPHGFDSSKRYPLFVYVYQGPNSQLINTRFSVGMLQVFASQLNCVVVTVDGRGTGFKGKEFRWAVYKNLSHYETIDQINAAKTYIKQNSFIDPERTLIYGHSYGGYMTLKTLENDDEKVFKYGVSGAPVTDWRLYDSIYTERYMSTPELNGENYARGAVGGSGKFENFQKTKRFLVLHGTGDDNVHIQNLFKALDKFNLNNVENNYDLMVFPDSNHGISYHNAGYIMYNKILWWAKMAFLGVFDAFDQYDYHNGNLEFEYGAMKTYDDLDDKEFLSCK